MLLLLPPLVLAALSHFTNFLTFFLNSNALNTYFCFVEETSSSFLFFCSLSPLFQPSLTFPPSPVHQNDEASDTELVEALICSTFVNNVICQVPLRVLCVAQL